MRYSRDPFWMTARFASKCACGKEIAKSSQIFYYPSSHTAICETCGQQGYRDLLAEKSMDEYGNDLAYER